MKPIRTEKELEAARRQVFELRRQLAMFKDTYRHDKDACELASRGLRELMHETARAITAYEQAQAGQVPAVVGARNPRTGLLELPRLLRRLRLTAQLDQAEMARRIGTQQPNIARWEREGYDGYNLRALQRFADALGYDLEVSFLRRHPHAEATA